MTDIFAIEVLTPLGNSRRPRRYAQRMRLAGELKWLSVLVPEPWADRPNYLLEDAAKRLGAKCRWVRVTVEKGDA